MTTTPSSAIGEALLQQMAAEIREEIPEAEVRLYSCGEACGYGSHARGDASPADQWICCCSLARRRSNDCSCTAAWSMRPTSMGGGSMADADALALAAIARRDLLAARGNLDRSSWNDRAEALLCVIEAMLQQMAAERRSMTA
jgi:hypothetical protein